MFKQKNLILARNIFITLGFMCLLLTLVFLLRFVTIRIEKNTLMQAPVEVSHRVLFISSYNPLYFTYESQKKGLSTWNRI